MRVSYYLQILSSTLASLSFVSVLLGAPRLDALAVGGFFWLLTVVAAVWHRKMVEIHE
jgi:hypothetical protein